MKVIAKSLIRFYQVAISSWTPGVCRYTPTCSSYTYQAVEKHGFVKGILMGAWRILRCNPFSRGGFDPVRENYKGKAKWLL